MTDEQIDAVFDAMPRGARGFCVDWGYRQFAREVLAAREMKNQEALPALDAKSVTLTDGGVVLWVSVRALERAIDDHARTLPIAYAEQQAIDDVRVLVRADPSTKPGAIIQRLQDVLALRNRELRTLRQLYCAVSAATDALAEHEPPNGMLTAPTEAKRTEP